MHTQTDGLAESAALVWELSRRSCRVDPATRESCRWQHGLWLWLRALGLNTSPARFAPFYREALQSALGRRPAPRILVSGAADSEMLARVADACAEPRRATIALVDLCETPLALSRRFAAERGLDVATQRADVLAYAPAVAFDAICTDSFLGQFAPAARARLVAHWARLLARGGSVITVNRLRPGADPEQRVSFTPEQAHAFSESVLSAAAELPEELRPSRADLAREVARYTQRQRAWPVRSAEELEALFARAGFKVESLEVAPMDGGAAQATAPTLAGGALYARIHARLA